MARLRLLALFGLACIWSPVPSAFASGSVRPVDVGTYVRAVHAERLALDRLSGSPSSAPQVARVQARLRSLGAVRLPDGRIVRTDLPLLAAEMQAGSPTSLRAVALRVDELDLALRALPRQAADPARLGALDAVLRDPRFHSSCFFLGCVADWLGGIVNRLVRGIPPPPALDLKVELAVAVLFLALLTGVTFLVAREALARTAGSVEGREPETGVDPRGQAEQRLAAAAAAGDYRLALRYLFLSTLLTLQERGELQLRPDLTNREFLRSLGAGTMRCPPDVEKALGELTDQFDSVWYGHRPFTAAEFARSRELARRALAERSTKQVA